MDCFIPKPLFRNSLFGAFAGAVKGSRPVEEKAEKPDFDNCRILLAEDNELNREIAKTLLKMHGMEAVSYTHLDVYKRQIIYCCTSNRFFQDNMIVY